MTTLSDKELIGLPVETKSGTALGKVQGFQMDADTGTITQYTVKSNNPLKELFGKELLVAASQVITITAEKMTVDDLLAGEKGRVPAPSGVPTAL